MDKREILQRNREERKEVGMDEREEAVWNDSYGYGLMTVLALVLFFFLSNYVTHQTISYDSLPIFTGYLTSTSFYKYRRLHANKYLIAAILGFVATIAGTVVFFLEA